MSTSTMTRTPYLAAFPVSAKATVDWSDHGQAHRAVMRLFPETLPGTAGERRADANILYRLDEQPGEPLVIVQSDVPFETLPVDARSMNVPVPSWDIPVGTLVRFRVAVNPVARRTVDGRARTRVVTPDETLTWLTRRIGHCMDNVEIVDEIRTETTATSHGRSVPPRLAVSTLDGFATVTDSDAFADLRRRGVGREKAYGCGLMSAFRVG